MTETIDKFLGTGPKPVALPVEEKPDAPEEGKEPEGNQPEHPDGDEGGSPTEAGDSDRPAEGRKGKAAHRKGK